MKPWCENPDQKPEQSLRVEGLRFELPTVKIEADFQIAPGERAILQGPSGSGKTTLLRLIAGLEAPSEGRIYLGSREIGQLAPQYRRIGYVFQEQVLFPNLNVLDNVSFGLRLRGVPRKKRDQIGLAALERVGLSEQALGQTQTLSGGERQRVAMLRAFLWGPDLLMLDEPFSALDGAARERLRSLLLEFQREWPCPVLFVSHDPADAKGLANCAITCTDDFARRVRIFQRPGKQLT